MRETQYTIAKMSHSESVNVSLVLKKGVHKFQSTDINQVKPDIIISFANESKLDEFLRSAVLVS
jgi:undecaprenyl pyrophosphate synthase